MRHGIFGILKENVKLIHLCACMDVYTSTGGGRKARNNGCVGECMGRPAEGRGSKEKERRQEEVSIIVTYCHAFSG